MSLATRDAEPFEVRPLTADEVLGMVAAGILDPDERIELLEGRLVRMSPQGPTHQMLVYEIAKRLERVYEGVAHVPTHMTMRGGPHGLPEPDVGVVRGNARDYATRLPTGRDLILVIEVSHSTRRKDLRKASTYAGEGVPHYWIVDIDRRSVTVYTDPAPDEGSFCQMRTLLEDDVVTAPESEASWPVREMLP